jgi:ABC transporter substrate binding protein (PQQ-dependent alcohol dehydrogenase system)
LYFGACCSWRQGAPIWLNTRKRRRFDRLNREGYDLGMGMLVSLARLILLALGTALLTPGFCAAQAIDVVYLAHRIERAPGLSELYAPPMDEGMQGARLALRDTQSRLRFLPKGAQAGLVLRELVVEPSQDFIGAARAAMAGAAYAIVDAPADELLALADAPEARGKLLFNIGAPETRLREKDCRANLLHTAPSTDMLSDALVQFLARKRWSKLFLVAGTSPADVLYADAIRASARKFGAKIVADKSWASESELRRSAQADASAFTQGPEHDVIVVADVASAFGEALPYNSWSAKPVVGTQGLVALAWDRTFEQWGATQLQNRFKVMAARDMTSKDWAAWMALRTIGEALAKSATPDATVMNATIQSPAFRIDGFKGRSLDYRSWSGQLRQPISLVHPRAVVSVSPQEGYLHPVTDLDTLGADRPESTCKR